jgi:hypothetical protein
MLSAGHAAHLALLKNTGQKYLTIQSQHTWILVYMAVVLKYLVWKPRTSQWFNHDNSLFLTVDQINNWIKNYPGMLYTLTASLGPNARETLFVFSSKQSSDQFRDQWYDNEHLLQRIDYYNRNGITEYWQVIG